MRFGSVCSGIEAASVAWHPLGWTTAWLSEIEPFPCAVLKYHYPDVPNHGDMTLLPEKILSGEVEAPDLFCGGTPCQAFSVAGLRNSLDDARGNLSLTFVGIANAIDHVRSLRGESAGIIFWENVPGVLNTKDNAFGCFLGALAGENDPLMPSGEKWTNAGCVYGPQRTVAWRVLDAQYFGVAQRRRRVFVVASARDNFNPTEILFEFEGLRRDIAPSREAGKVTPTISSSGTGVSRVGFNCEDEWFVEAQVTSRMVAFGEYVDDDTASAMKARDYKDATDLVSQPIPLNTMNLLGREIYDGKRGFGIGKAGDPSPTLTKNHSHAVAQPVGTDLYNGTITGDISMTLKRGDGNPAINQPTVMVAPTLTASNDPSRSPQSTEVTNQVAAVHAVSMAVRRLTPIECERLQGFADNYSNIPWRGKPESPDGPRYKALGNSWAVPVVRWIGQRIQKSETSALAEWKRCNAGSE